MKILVLFTGGTIGSTVDGATVHTDPAAASRLLSGAVWGGCFV